MIKSMLNSFRKTLEDRQTELGNNNRDREILAIQTSSDEMDRIQYASERDYAVDKLERNSSRLGEVRAALLRIDAGTFGSCVECGEDINRKRLAAVPWAPLCIVCQDAADREQKTSFSDIDKSSVMTM